MKKDLLKKRPFLAFYSLLRLRGIYSVSEKRREHLMRGYWRAAVATLIIGASSVATALPVPNAAQDLANIATSVDGKTMTISADGSYTWDAFNISQGNLVDITSTGLTVHKGMQSASEIMGTLQSAGSVYILNQHGITVGGTVNVAGDFIAAAVKSLDDSTANTFTFSGLNGNVTIQSGAVVNAGGFAYLVGKVIDNQGAINADEIALVGLGATAETDSVTIVKGANGAEISWDIATEDATSSVTAGSLNGKTNADLANIAIATLQKLSVGTEITAKDLNIKASEVDQTAALKISGTATITAENITLENTDNNFANISVVDASSVKIADVDGIVLDSISADSLNVTAGGAVTQNGAATVTGAATITATGNDITLDNANNAFGSIGATGAAVTINESDAVALDTITSTILNVTAGGAVTQNGAATVTGAATITATGNDITLDNANNAFGSIGATGAAVTINESDAVALDTITSTILNVTAGGAVTQNGAATVTGAATITATGNDITLDNANNAFGSIGATGAAVTINESDAVALDTITSTILNVTAGGAVTQNGAATVTGAATITATGNDITLDNVANDFTGAVTATGKDVSLKDAADGIALGAITATGNLDVTAQGAITQSAAADVDGTTKLAANGNDITLDNAANDFTGAVTADGKNITLNNNAALTLGAVTASGDLDVTAQGAITQSAAADVDGTTTLVANGNNITLDNAANDFTGVVTATGKDVTLKDAADGIVLGAVTATGNLDVTAEGEGAITQTATDKVVAGATTLKAAGDITLANAANDFTGAVAATGKDVTLKDKNSISLGDISSESLSVKAENVSVAGSKIQVGQFTQNAEGNLTIDATSGNIEITGGAQVGASGTATLNASGAVTVDGSELVSIDALTVNGAKVEAKNGANVASQNAVAITGTTSVTVDGSKVGSDASTTISGGTVIVKNNGAVYGETDVNITATSGDAIIGSVTAKKGLVDIYANGNADIGSVSAATSADVYASGNASIDNASIGGAANISVAGNTDIGRLSSGTLDIVTQNLSADSIDTGRATFDTDDLTIKSLDAKDVEVTAENVQIDAMKVNTLDLTSGTIDAGSGVWEVKNLTIDASGNVGSSTKALKTRVDNIESISGSNVYIDEQSSSKNVNLGSIIASGDIMLRAANVGGTDGTAGGFIDANGDAYNINAGGNFTLDVGGGFGTAIDPMEVKYGNDMTIKAGNLSQVNTGYGFLHAIYNGTIGIPTYDNIVGLVIANGQIVGGHPQLIRSMNRALAFTVNTPELKSVQGVFGDPGFIHTKMDVSDASSIASVDNLSFDWAKEGMGNAFAPLWDDTEGAWALTGSNDEDEKNWYPIVGAESEYKLPKEFKVIPDQIFPDVLDLSKE